MKINHVIQTNRSKGYGFIAFVSKTAAARAIEEMNHKRIGGREVRTNWATSKRAPPQVNKYSNFVKQLQWGPFLYLKHVENRAKKEPCKKRAFSAKNESLTDFSY